MWKLSKQRIFREGLLIWWIQVPGTFFNAVHLALFQLRNKFERLFYLGVFFAWFVFLYALRWRSTIPLVCHGITLGKNKWEDYKTINFEEFIPLWMSVENNPLFVACVLLWIGMDPAVPGKTSAGTWSTWTEKRSSPGLFVLRVLG